MAPRTPISAAIHVRLERTSTSTRAKPNAPMAFRVWEISRVSKLKARSTQEKEAFDLRPLTGNNLHSAIMARKAPDWPTALEPVAGMNPLSRESANDSLGHNGICNHTQANSSPYIVHVQLNRSS